jgi:hypothetical protein
MIRRLKHEAIQSRTLLVKAITEGDDATILSLADRYIRANANYNEALQLTNGIQANGRPRQPTSSSNSRSAETGATSPYILPHIAFMPSFPRTVSRHQCFIYEGPPSQHLGGLAAVMVKQLSAGYRCVYLNSPPMVAGIRSYLSGAEVKVSREVQRGALVLSSDRDHLVAGRFNVEHMLTLLETSVTQALHDGFAGLWATGDMTWELGSQKEFSKLLEYEWGLEELFHRQPALSGVCQYHAETLPADLLNDGLQSHPTLFVNETLSRLNPCYRPASQQRPA